MTLEPVSATAPPLLVRDLARSLPFGNTPVHVLQGLSFQIDAGEWVALTGPSGSGKSTLLGLLGALDHPSAGSVVLDGTPLETLDESALARLRNRHIGIVFQDFNLIASLTAQENVEAPLYVGPRRRQARRLATEMLARVGLSDRSRHRPHQLSGGQRQRVAIARALVTEPTLLLADEPTGNLDSRTSADILDLIASLRRERTLTVVMVTHDPAVAQRADRVIHLVDGRLQADSENAPARTGATR